jgi:AraC-like DNA-binding protein
VNYHEVPSYSPYDQLINCVWFLTGRGDQYSPQPVVPDGRIELLVHRGDQFTVARSDGSTQRQECFLVAGQLTGPIHLLPGSWIDVVGIRLTPLGARAILGAPLHLFTDDVVSLGDVNRRVGAILERATVSAPALGAQADSIMAALAQSHSGPVDPRMRLALDAMSLGGAGSVSELATQCGMTPRTLERRFRSEVGLTPKMYQRVVRFRRAFRLLGETGQGAWAQVAVRSGYYDQAHMIRDFSQFAGAPPTSFFGSNPALAQAFSAGA